jgi:7,8-dihydroneopterin aldolase/epimerase/oxygenase
MSLTKGNQTLTLTGLRFNASLGVLAQEIDSPQPILVDAELNMVLNVLDYRKVRQAIIEECNAVHVNLLETMIGKLCNRLMGMPGVLGVRVKIAKLEIFDDCEVAIRMETGQW